MGTENTRQMHILKTENEELNKIALRISSLVMPEKIICYSSIIRKTEVITCFLEVEEASSPREKNNYGILVIPNEQDGRGNGTIQQLVENMFGGDGLVTAVVHRMEEVNQALKNGSAFFTNVYRYGQLLYDREQLAFMQPGLGKSKEVRIIRREQFWNKWHGLAKDFIDGAHFYLATQHHALAVYMLHQSTQHILSGVLRVLSGYRSNSNSLQRLCRLVETVLPQSPFILPKGSPRQARLTGLLLKGFSDARYNEKFEASTEEVTELIARTERLLATADALCCQKLENIRSGKTPLVR